MSLPINDNFVCELTAECPISVGDARAITRIAYLVAETDFVQNEDERDSMRRLVTSVWRAAGREPEEISPVSPLPIDDEERCAWVRQLAGEIETATGRELAYVAAYLMAASDQQLDREEGGTLEMLQRVLGIADERAAYLAAASAAAATPGVDRDAAPAQSIRD